MPELTPDFIKEFAVFLSHAAGLHNGSIWENCMWLKGVVMRAHFFVFASFTALSFVDIKELSNNQIVEVNGEKWIISKRHKTGVPFQVKLLDIPLQIIERYKAFQENNLVFPNLNYWSICKRMGKMIKECGITKKISFHCSRHGFAILALSKGMPIESVSRILGHTNIKTTQIYASAPRMVA